MDRDTVRIIILVVGALVIAGIYVTREGDAQSGVPVLKNIPFIGGLFRSHNVTSSHDELLIFITPRIVRG